MQEEIARRSSLKKVSAAAKTELSKYSAKYALTELLSCGNCGSPYRRISWARPEGRKIVWRSLNRVENGKKFCKEGPTLLERDVHAAVVAAMNEMFSQKAAKELLKDSIFSALSDRTKGMSLAAIDRRLSELKEKQYDLLQLAAAVGANSTAYDEELGKVSMEFSALVAQRTEAEKHQQDISHADSRVEQITAALDSVDGGVLDFDDVTVRQLFSGITVMGKDKLVVRFKDGTEIEQIIEAVAK